MLQNGAYDYDDDDAHGDDRENLDTKRNSKSVCANVNGSDENGIPDASNGGIKIVAHNNKMLMVINALEQKMTRKIKKNKRKK